MTLSNLGQEKTSFWKDINSTRLFVVIQGTIGGLAGMVHGINEILMGNKPAARLVFDYATGAFTIFPTYLSSGIAVVCLGLALMVWTIGFIQRKNGPAIFLFISILLFLAGGGIAQVAFFLIAWGVSTRINRPSDWWKNDLSGKARKRLARAWVAFFSGGYLFLFIGIAMWLIFTPPGTLFQTHRTEYLICWMSLLVGFILQILAIVSGFARELERQKRRKNYAPSH
jgi:hypothetical protein